MADHPVVVLMRNHIKRMRAEFPALDADVIERIYEMLVVALSRQPTEDELRARVAELSRYDDATLRAMLWLPPKQGVRASGGGHGPADPPDAADRDGARAVRRPGRPGWTTALFRARYREACDRSSPPHSFGSVAPNFDTLDGHRGIDPDHLRKLARRFGLPPG